MSSKSEKLSPLHVSHSVRKSCIQWVHNANEIMQSQAEMLMLHVLMLHSKSRILHSKRDSMKIAPSKVSIQHSVQEFSFLEQSF